MGHKHICLPCASEGQYREYVDTRPSIGSIWARC